MDWYTRPSHFTVFAPNRLHLVHVVVVEPTHAKCCYAQHYEKRDGYHLILSCRFLRLRLNGRVLCTRQCTYKSEHKIVT